MYELVVVLRYVSHASLLEQRVAVVHFLGQGVERLHNLCNVGYDWFFLVRHFRQELTLYLAVQRELHLLRVNHHELHVSRMLGIQQRCDDGVQSDRLTLTGSTSHEHVRRLGKVEDEHLVRDSLTKSYRQSVFLLCLLILLRTHHRHHGHDLLVLVRNFYTDSTLARNWRDDTYASSRKTEHYVTLEALDFRYSDTRLWYNLVKRDCRSYCSRDACYLDAVVAQCRCYSLLVGVLLLEVYGRLFVAVILEQRQFWIFVMRQVERRVVFSQFVKTWHVVIGVVYYAWCVV